ncbi:unnamed protein product [Phytophthora lilii]|uniref:Unnamed protein product n=1 Tax=Phytophthora lilii TaxID=2077276 RepID=A0A9W6U4M3_9STRA|nr:unnamed protein product [Phytophthora lilii]
MAQSKESETYAAFKARKHQEFDRHYAGRTLATQQQLLRVHLRHFLLTVGAEVGDKRAEAKPLSDRFKHNDAKVGEIGASGNFASVQKRLAVDREAAKAARQRSARTIQNFVRHYRRSVACENEKELPSTSVLVPTTTESLVAPQNLTNIPPVDTNAAPHIPIPKTTFPPYEMVVELVAAREISLGSTSDGKYIEAELQLKRQSKVIVRAVSPRQFLSCFQDSNTEILLQDCSLRFAIDLGNGMKYGITSPHTIIEEWSANIILKASGNNGGGNATILGIVGVPFSLLEPPLATEYALCRWFPLEKAYPGHTARGCLRVSVCYLMRQASSDSVMMVPFSNTTNSQEMDQRTAIPQENRKPLARRVKKASKTTAGQRKPKGKHFQRKQACEETTDTEPPKKQISPVLSLKDSLSSPIGRISRAEALSPPSSPSSVASSETGESAESPKTKRQVKTSRRFFPPKRQQKLTKAIGNSPLKDDETGEVEATSPRPTPKPTFLKRKPYKVVFHKLDWSGVSSKTDSNLPTSSSSRTNSGVASRISRGPRSSGRALKTSAKVDSSNEDVDVSSNAKPEAFIDADTARRLAALESTIYESCSVTRESASLARFKYQTERKKFVAKLQSQALSRVNGDSRDPDQPPSQESCEQQICTSEASVTELWKKLTSDSSGKMYASMLRSLTGQDLAV